MPHAELCRVAFVGAGSMIAEHARAFSSLPNVELVGIYNRTKEKARVVAETYAIDRVGDDLEGMVAELRPDLVVMAVYEPAILEMATRLMAFPSALLLEKPLGLDIREARKLHALGKNLGRKVWVGLNRRTMASTQAALADLDNNPGPRFIHVQDQQSLDTARSIGHVQSVVDNWMYANSIHLVDYMLAFGRGDIQEVKVLQPWDPQAPGTVVAHVHFSSGDTGLYQATWNGPGPWACTVSAPHRRWEMRPLEKAVFQNAGERVLNEVPPAKADVDYKPGFLLQAEKVVGAWRMEKTGAATIDDALATSELVATIYGLKNKE